MVTQSNTPNAKIVNGLEEKLKLKKVFEEQKEKVLKELLEIRMNNLLKISDFEELRLAVHNSIETCENYIRDNLQYPKEQQLLNFIDRKVDEIILQLKGHNLSDEDKESIISNLFGIEKIIGKYNDSMSFLDDFLQKPIQDALSKVNTELQNFNRLRNIADNDLTEDIYSKAVTKYQTLETDYRRYFYWGIALTFLLSILIFTFKPCLMNILSLGEGEDWVLWILKGSIIIIGITLTTYFLKQSAHYQKLADQNYQTQVELQAYPKFMESVPADEAASIRKELALKYFGKEIDKTQIDKIGDLIQDQMKASTDMVKASTELVSKLTKAKLG